MRKRRTQNGAIDEINMTPLIDITFFLLVIFIITMPIIEFSTSVTPPQLNAKDVPEENKSVSIDKEGKIIYNKMAISSEQLLEELRKLKMMNAKITLLLRADGSRPYKEVIELMRTIKNSGFQNISLVTQAESKSR
jgi:biopolymer transport protein ExbD